MRKSPIDVLFPKIRQQILAATYGQPERWWFLSELANSIKASPSSLQREIKALTTSGILREKRDGNRLYVRAEIDSPIFNPLQELIAKTLGIKSVLKEALGTLENKINWAFIYGSVARGEDYTQSDIDLMIVGGVGLSEIAVLLSPIEMKFNREVNAVCYNTEEFTRKVKSGDHFLTNILRNEKIFLVGDQNELDKISDR